VSARKPVPVDFPPALALGAFALGALAVGALAIGYLAIRRLAVKRAHIHTLEIDNLIVHRHHEPMRMVPPPSAGDNDPWSHPENAPG
jgi:hypothetical protein